MKRGEVRWYSFAHPDKNRPVLVLTRNSVIEYLGEVTVAPLTRTIRDIPSEVRLTAEDRLPETCAVNCDHLQTVAKSKLGSRITTLSPHRMSLVQQAIAFALELD